MDTAEIQRYVELGRWRNVAVDIRLMPQYPGVVRSVVFYRGNRVCIEFSSHGSDEGGYNYCCDFDSIEEAFDSIEEYLGLPIADWTNYNKSGQYPGISAETDFQRGCRALISDILGGRIWLPRKGDFRQKEDVSLIELEGFN